METRFTVLLIEIGVALALQIGILFAILLAVKKSSARMMALAEEVQRRALPTLDAAQSLLTTTRPKIEALIGDAAAASTSIKNQVERLDATVSDVIDRTRLHVIRADELVTRTLDRVEETTDLVHHSVISPVRQVAGIVQGLTAGLGTLLGRRARSHAGQPHDEMFI
jgi:chromatin segregation and condensation protein Rec8/ScpA/Scc1 (kleisin family)